MTKPSLSDVLREVVREAEDIAYEAGQDPGSTHLLLALFTVRNSADRFLRDRGVDEARLLRHLPRPPRSDPPGAVRAIMAHAAELAARRGSSRIEPLHVLVGITRARDCAAFALLEGAGARPARLRSHALTELTAEGTRRKAEEPAGGPHPPSWQPPLRTPPGLAPLDAPPPPSRGRGAGRSRGAPAPEAPSARVEPAGPAPRHPEPVEGRRGPAETPGPPTLPSRRPESVEGRRGPAEAPGPSTLPSRRPGPPGASAPSTVQVAEPEIPASPPRPQAPIPEDPGAAWLLPSPDFPWLSSLGRNLSAEAARGELDELHGREDVLEAIRDVLGKRRANNPCLVGEPGVGKTAIVEGLALAWTRGSEAERARIVIGIDPGRLLMGTHLRGSFSERLQGLQDEVRRAEGKVLVFFDELHTLLGAGGGGDGASDAGEALKVALARGDFPCVGATTPDAFEREIGVDPALRRRFVPIPVEEPSRGEATALVARALPAYAEHHGVGYAPEAVEAAVNLTVRFLPEERLPDKALGLLDLAGSRAGRAGRAEIDAGFVGQLLAERLGLPADQLGVDDEERLAGLEAELQARVVGHREALGRIAAVIRRHAAGFRSHRPRGSFLLVGPSGVGKTETAKALAEVLHGDAAHLLRFDLSEFGEAHSVARLIGAPPGYVGHDAGGQLTEAVRRRPGRVLLFDEVEKAHREVLQLLLQILDEGHLGDGRGRRVSFTETTVVMTSNAGAERVRDARRIGFGDAPPDAERDASARFLQAAKASFPPELWGRIDEKLAFPPLTPGEVRRIAQLLVAASSARLARERGISFDLDPPALELVVEQGGRDARLGARPLRRVLGHLVENPIASRILEGRLRAGEHVRVGRAPSGGLVFRVAPG